MDAAILELILALAAGLGLGVWFFGGLLWTVRRVPAARHPVLWVLVSFAIRLAVVVAGMVWLARRHWLLPIVAFVGFVAIRTSMMLSWRQPRLDHPAE